jgi:hypothetical protein
MEGERRREREEEEGEKKGERRKGKREVGDEESCIEEEIDMKGEERRGIIWLVYCGADLLFIFLVWR